MRNITRGVATAAVLAGVAVGLAGTASAGPLDGIYTATITGASVPDATIGDTMTVMLNDCGAGCTSLLSSSSSGWVGDLHLQGNTWLGQLSNAHTGTACNGSLDNSSLSFVLDCPTVPANVQYSLAKK